MHDQCELEVIGMVGSRASFLKQFAQAASRPSCLSLVTAKGVFLLPPILLKGDLKQGDPSKSGFYTGEKEDVWGGIWAIIRLDARTGPEIRPTGHPKDRPSLGPVSAPNLPVAQLLPPHLRVHETF